MEEIQRVKFFCERYGIRPSKKLGQNFLIDNSVARKMCAAAELAADDIVLEIGPGFGALTMEIAKKVKKVLAVEIDKRMAEAAREILSEYKNVEVAQGDILKIPNSELFATLSDVQAAAHHLVLYKVVANLPYSITSAVLRKFTEEKPRPSLIVIMVQKEVAERVCARPSPQPSPALTLPSPSGRGDGGEGRGRKGEGMSVLSVAVQYYGKPEIVATVPRGAFWPEPEVDSAVLRIEIYGGRTSDPTEVRPPVDEKRLFQLVRIGFSSRRKQLQNNLAAWLASRAAPRGSAAIGRGQAASAARQRVIKALETAGLDPKIRAQELSVQEWITLSNELSL